MSVHFQIALGHVSQIRQATRKSSHLPKQSKIGHESQLQSLKFMQIEYEPILFSWKIEYFNTEPTLSKLRLACK